MIHSLLPPEPEPEPELQPIQLPEPPGGRFRTPGAGFRRRLGLEAMPPLADPPPPVPREPEMARPLSDGEPVRVAVVVQMPTECDAVSALSDDDEIAWRPGMEIGVWEGMVVGRKRSISSDETEPNHTFTQYASPVGPPPSHRPANLSIHPNPYVPFNLYDSRSRPSVDTGNVGSGSTLWTPAKLGPSPSTPHPSRPGPMEPTPEVSQPEPAHLSGDTAFENMRDENAPRRQHTHL